MKKALLAGLLCLALVCVLAPVAARASAYSFDISAGNVVITISAQGTYTIDVGGVMRVINGSLADEDVELTGSSTTNNIVIDGNSVAGVPPLKLTLSNLSVQVDNNAMWLEDGAKVELTLKGANTLTTASTTDAAVRVPVGATLIIQKNTSDTDDKLIVAGPNTAAYGAAIGGNGTTSDNSTGDTGGTVTINSGTVIATSTNGAAIGGGGGYDKGGAGGTVTINGGTVTATGSRGAGIGGGYGGVKGGDGGSLTMTGGELQATSTSGAAIGGGGSSSSGTQGAAATVTLTGYAAYEWTRTSADSVYQPGATAAFENNNNAGFAGIRPAGTYSLAVTAPVPASLAFGTAAVGYAPPAAQTVTVKNTGNRALAVTVNGTATYEVNTTGLPASLAPDATASFTVRPKANLADSATPYAETLAISGSNGASASVGCTFTVNPALGVSLSGRSNLLGGASCTLAATATGGVPPYAYQWSGSTATTQSITVAPTASTTYTVTVTDQGGGSASDSYAITVYPTTLSPAGAYPEGHCGGAYTLLIGAGTDSSALRASDMSGLTLTPEGGAPVTLTEGAQYTKADGSIRVTLAESYLNTLPVGRYTLTAAIGNGDFGGLLPSVPLAVTPYAPLPPKTGDGAPLWLWVGLALLAAGGAAALPLTRRRRGK